MTLLSDRTLKSRLTDADAWETWQMLKVLPLRPGAIQPCSIDVHLAGPMKIYTGPHTDTRRDNSPWWKVLTPAVQATDADGVVAVDLSETGAAPTSPSAWVLQPNRLYLAVLDEVIGVPEDVCGQIQGVSSRARDGITVHQQAGLLDPGWVGRATLEISVTNAHTVVYAGQRIAQVTFTLLDGRCEIPYGGRYQGDLAPQPARMTREGVAA
jgi:dCTP deaminase